MDADKFAEQARGLAHRLVGCSAYIKDSAMYHSQDCNEGTSASLAALRKAYEDGRRDGWGKGYTDD